MMLAAQEWESEEFSTKRVLYGEVDNLHSAESSWFILGKTCSGGKKLAFG